MTGKKRILIKLFFVYAISRALLFASLSAVEKPGH